MQFDYTIFRDVVGACRDVYPNWMRFSDVCAHVPRRSRQQVDDCIRALEPEGVWELRTPVNASGRYDYEIRVCPDKLPPAEEQTVQ